MSPLYEEEEEKKKSESEREKERVRGVEVDSDEDIHTERWASFLLQSIPKQQDDVTALNYPWCFAGKMNEVGHVEGVNEDTHTRTHLHFICILIMWSDSCITQCTGEKKMR